MNNEEIKELMDYCESKKLMYFEFVSDNRKIVFRKTEMIADMEIELKPEVFEEQKNRTIDIRDSNESIIPIESPYVGIITFSEKILKGEVRVNEKTEICTIEAMKIYNSIISPVNGTIKEILVDDGSLVEYGQLILTIEADKL